MVPLACVCLCVCARARARAYGCGCVCAVATGNGVLQLAGQSPPALLGVGIGKTLLVVSALRLHHKLAVLASSPPQNLIACACSSAQACYACFFTSLFVFVCKGSVCGGQGCPVYGGRGNMRDPRQAAAASPYPGYGPPVSMARGSVLAQGPIALGGPVVPPGGQCLQQLRGILSVCP
eukprot:1128962-Pelagomonas_calceolata.AAC.5